MASASTEFLVDLLRRYSPSGREKDVADLISHWLTRQKCFDEVTVGESGNIYALRRRGSPNILFCGHMDTVPGRLPVKLEGGRLSGRGAVDAKSALAAMALACTKLAQEGFPGSLVLTAVVDEERGGRGALELLARNFSVDYAIFGEPSGVDKVAIGYNGRIAFWLTCHTKSAHVATPWMGENAILRLVEAVEAIRAHATNKLGEGQSKATAEVTLIRGGHYHNMIPSTCRALVDIRIPLGLEAKAFLDDVNGLPRKLERPGVAFEVNLLDITEPYQVARASPLVRAMVRACLRVRGRRPLLVRKTGTSDLNTFCGKTGVPGVAYGPGDSRLSHTSEEAVGLDEYADATRVYENAALELHSLHSKL